VKKQYFFAYLFVRAAKGLALLVILIGVGFCVLRYYQASIAAGAVAYQPSSHLQQALDRLKAAFLATEQIIDSFNAGNQSKTPNFQAPRFPLVIDSENDFARISAELSRVDHERQQLKESIVSRFENLVKSIEEKLHAYSAVLQSSPSPTTATAQNLISKATPTPSPTSREESLFLSQLGSSDANERSENLKERKEFLKVLAMRAENADNRVILGEAADQLERLAKLLPERFNASTAAQPDTATASSKDPQAEQHGKVLLSERVARQLEQLRGGVRQMLLTSWTLDDTFEQVANLGSAERDKYRAAILAQKSVWLSAASRIVIGLLATGLVSLLIVVFADLVQTQLDTATSSGTVADAVNALRGQVAQVSDPAQMTMAGEDWPAEGGS
jgi:rubrerythrin